MHVHNICPILQTHPQYPQCKLFHVIRTGQNHGDIRAGSTLESSPVQFVLATNAYTPLDFIRPRELLGPIRAISCEQCYYSLHFLSVSNTVVNR